MMQAMPLFMASLPPEPPSRTAVRKAGMERAQHGMAQTVHGASITLTSHLKPQNALLLAAALRDVAATSASERADILKLLQTARAQTTDAKVMDALNAAEATVSNFKN